MKQIKISLLLLLLARIAWIDSRTKQIPRIYLWLGYAVEAILWIVERIWTKQDIWESMVIRIISVTSMILFFSIVRELSDKGIGMGDIKLIGIVTLVLGISTTMKSLCCAMLFVLIEGGVWYVKYHEKKVPFVPAFFCGTAIVMLLDWI